MNLISRKIRKIRNSIVLKILIRRAGGDEQRKSRRITRIKSIRATKDSIRRDLLNSWRLREIKSPDPEDFKVISGDSKVIPISKLNSIKKKYWGGNIYNEF